MAPKLPTLPTPKVPGLIKGLGVTLKTMLTPAITRQYPHEKPDLPPRTRGVIALMDENCTVCMLCSRECPDWCIYIESHKELVPPAREGGRARTRNVLDRFAIDFALCMYCGICIEVCPFDALFWSPEFEYSTYSIAELTHEQEQLRAWMDTVPPPPRLEDGADPSAEVAAALQRAKQQRQQAVQAQAETVAPDAAPAVAAAAAPAAAPAASPAATPAAAPASSPAATRTLEPEIQVEAGEVDQETYDQLIAEGKSERVARARAKAAWVRKEKARLRAEMATRHPTETGAAAETADQIAEGAPASAGVAATSPAEPITAPTPHEAAPVPAEPITVPTPQEAASAPADEVHVEGGEIDPETYQRLIAEGKSERIARAQAKAAWVRKEKARLRAERGQRGETSEGQT